jgi:hypothetical protein
LALSYNLCVAYDLLFHQTMYRAWIALLPGMAWLTWGSFFLAKVWRYAP